MKLNNTDYLLWLMYYYGLLTVDHERRERRVKVILRLPNRVARDDFARAHYERADSSVRYWRFLG